MRVAGQGDEDEQKAAKCQFYLSKKRRYCKFEACPGQLYCGNHLFNGDSEQGKRVPCPIDPKHTVLESEVDKHIFKCPANVRIQGDKSQPYYEEDHNAGSEEDPELLGEALPDGVPDSIAARRAHCMRARGATAFTELLARIERAHQEVCGPPETCCELRPPESEPFLREDNERPFSLKHALQQASIIGHMQRFGLVGAADECVHVEFGAGKGYLSSMLASCCGARRLVLLDRSSFRFKADRSLRKDADMSFERIRVDIKDFRPAGLPALLAAAPQGWTAIGKHLCGAATDFTLRCCVTSLGESSGGSSSSDAGCSGRAVGACCGEDGRGSDSGSGGRSGGGNGSGSGGQLAQLRGLAVATCCHHRCSWRHFVGKPLFRRLGFTPQEFELVSWMTGWALCGHDAPPGEGGEDEDAAGCEAEVKRKRRSGRGRRHHAQQPAAATPNPATAQLFPGAEEIAAGPAASPAGPAEQPVEQNELVGGAAEQEANGAAQLREDVAASPRLAAVDPSRSPSAHDGVSRAECMEAGDVAAAHTGGDARNGVTSIVSEANGGTKTSPESRSAAEGDTGPFDPLISLSRAERIVVGQKCKRLIDAGRLDWLRSNGMQAESKLYVSPAISGENRLLLAKIREKAL